MRVRFSAARRTVYHAESAQEEAARLGLTVHVPPCPERRLGGGSPLQLSPRISPSWDFALAMWIGDGTAQFHGKDGNGNGTFNGSVGNQAQWIRGTTTMHFRGQSILRQSIAKLASLGMSMASLRVSLAQLSSCTWSRLHHKAV